MLLYHEYCIAIVIVDWCVLLYLHVKCWEICLIPQYYVYRLVEIIAYKIFNVQKDDAQLECITNAATKLYRIEEIPKDELDLADDELIVQVAHFTKVWLLFVILIYVVLIIFSMPISASVDYQHDKNERYQNCAVLCNSVVFSCLHS